MDVAAIGMGMAAGYYTLPIAYKLTGSSPAFRPYLGAVNVAAGSLLIALAPRRAKMRKLVRETGAMIAGVGVYDLLACNIKALALPSIPESNALVNQIPGMAASYQVARRPVSRPASMMGASYAYGPVSYGASYEAPSARTAGLGMGSDDPFNGIWQ